MAISDIQLKDPSLLIGQNYINGKWIESESGKRFNVTDPTTGALIGSCPESDSKYAHKAIQAAAAAMPAWRSREDLTKLITWENGKAKPDANGEVISAASFLEWFSEEAARVYGDVIPHSQPNFRVSVLKEPVGVCGLITPWNFPAAMITRKLGPALAAGCTVVVKTAGETPFTANAVLKLGPNFYEPTILTNITADMLVVKEEIFGPVAPIFTFDTEDEAIATANKCNVGLASYIFTKNGTRANRVSELLQFGMVAVNTGVVSDAASREFGGIKNSGMGREGSKYGIEDYLQMKTVVTGNINVVYKASL
ncbi:hypothetical protein N7478_008108 [Penicillium angulare]|uniref:uncharacterized protein n=1 Tax=Penicillium angulare TaxID=116970 RepID=UPI0025403559|nr:uncharacterized protein N7478_008108 [Penicillium angulare]KAJ5272983.1 hypothetical protein N7478_008108 [Penicillium angulare]